MNIWNWKTKMFTHHFLGVVYLVTPPFFLSLVTLVWCLRVFNAWCIGRGPDGKARELIPLYNKHTRVFLFFSKNIKTDNGNLV